MSRTPPLSPQPAGPTHYQLLQLPVTASSQQLRQAFRTLSKRYHPDTTSLPTAQAEANFQRLQQAYGVLSDPARRRAYDAQLLLAQTTAQGMPQGLAPSQRLASTPSPRPLSVRRALSGGEWFALLLLALALVFSLVLGVGLAWARGVELVRRPSWWIELPAELPAPAPPIPLTPPIPLAPSP